MHPAQLQVRTRLPALNRSAYRRPEQQQLLRTRSGTPKLVSTHSSPVVSVILLPSFTRTRRYRRVCLTHNRLALPRLQVVKLHSLGQWPSRRQTGQTAQRSRVIQATPRRDEVHYQPSVLLPRKGSAPPTPQPASSLALSRGSSY